MALASNQRGEGGFKAILSIAVVVYLVFCGMKLLPAWSDDKAIEAKTLEVLKFAGTNRQGVSEMALEIQKRAKELNIDLKKEAISVEEDGGDFRARFTYERKVPLVFYTYRKTLRVDVRHAKY